MKKLITIFLLSLATLSAQAFLTGEIGKFKNAYALSINPMGNLFVSDINKNEIYKLDTLGNVQKFIGGYGWGTSAFSDPVDIYATTLNVYVADKNNNRIQIFDKDLNFLSEFKTSESEDETYSFGYPTCVANSPMGDLFVLDSDNSRILKYNLSGKFLQEIGSYDAGEFTLINPKKFAISPDGTIYVIDENNVIVFDQYGNGLNKFAAEIDPMNINITFSIMCLNNSSKIKIFNLAKPRSTPVLVDLSPYIGKSEIREAVFYQQKLYVLLGSEILIFSI